MADRKLATARDEFLRILGEARFDLVVLCRATNSRYGDAQTLVRTIHETRPETLIIVTFVSIASVSDYIAAVLDGKNVPVISMRDGAGYRDASHL